MEVADFLLASLFFFIFGLFFYVLGRLFYQRYIKSYDQEIAGFLHSKGLEMKDLKSPHKADWSTSPFDKPPGIRISFISLKFMGMYMSWTKRDYFLIFASNPQGKDYLYWLEINTTLLQKPELVFKEEKLKAKKKSTPTHTIVTKFNRCPACKHKLSKTDIICPDCGLHFE